MKTRDAETRTERDSLGPMEVPAEAYYGASTARAIQNFPISGLRFPRPFIRAIGLIKHAAAEVNADLGLLDRRLADAIARAAQEVADGAFDDEFPLEDRKSTRLNSSHIQKSRMPSSA